MILCWILFFNFCIAQTYVLNGNIKGLNGDSLLLLKVKGKVFEGQKIKVTNGLFHYQDKLEEPYFVQLFKLKKGTNETEGKLAEFLVSSGEITIFGPEPVFEQIKVEGSEPDRILKHYLKEDEVLMAKWHKVKIAYDSYVAEDDTLNRKKTAEEPNRILLQERIPLLKTYVTQNSNSIIGALIPNFCTLTGLLKKEDYLEMYSTLSSPMKATRYGKSVYERSK